MDHLCKILTKKNRLYIFMLISLFILTSCSQKVSTESVDKNNTAPDAQQTDYSINMDELKKALKAGVNDDIWYGGKYSWFLGFEFQKAEMEVYINPKFPEVISVYFDKPFKTLINSYDHNSQKIERKYFDKYFVIEIIINEYGYDPNLIGYYHDDTSSRIKERLVEHGYTVFYQKDEIEFGEVTQPVFPALTEERMKMIDLIEEAAVVSLKKNWSGKGKFKMYIRNFRENEDTTDIVLQDAEGQMWMTDISIGGKGSTNKVLLANFDTIEYTANQIKKVSFEREIEL